MTAPEIVLITGGASGIGAAFARHFLRLGAQVCIADRSERAMERFLAATRDHASRLETQTLDVRDADAVRRWIDDAVARHGRIDWLFNVAGIGVGGEAREYSLADWRDVIDVNVMGVAYGVHAAYPHMIRQGHGNLVNIASMSGLMPSPYTVSYGTAKHAVVGLSRSLRAEARHYGVNVIAVCPGVIDTPLLDTGEFGRNTRKLRAGAMRGMFEKLRPMDPDRFADAVMRQARRNRGIIVVPRAWTPVWWLNRLSIPLADYAASRGFLLMKRVYEENSE